ncbi:Leucine-rich repeat protein kinase family protein [Rhynchospora pubera]|uniref:non-specific serine/threonine protein kinase n=1 Tax=Rhynchospora pubera TaxID=906938 RepID=A0AAV8F2T5_9POAL|nr:Leucine-rich repeat protein kinase family protein [Rhynchospora pubera]
MRQRELLLVFLLCIAILVHPGFSYTDPDDVAVLNSLKKQWKNVPSDWKNSDPCGNGVGDGWVGIICHNYRVTNLTLFNMDIQGTLSEEIGNLKQLQRLDLSSNLKLGGTLPATLGNLIHLDSLKLVNCSFFGEIPDTLGNLPILTFLALNANNFTGRIPPSLGKLSKLIWLDLADNQLNGPLPVSVNDGWGLDRLLKAEHFHLNQNHFTGKIFEEIFTANMSLRHILLDRNQLEGSIPDSIGLVHTLEVIRLDENGLIGEVPSLSNLTRLNFLNLANNHLTGPLPNLTALTALNYLSLSNNQFDPSEVPSWLSNLEHLRTLEIESGQLHGQILQELFSFKELQEVNLKNNSLNGTFNMGNDVTSFLHTVNLELNDITSVTLSSNYSNNLMLMGNPVCSIPHLSTTAYCTDAFDQSSAIESLNITDCSHPFTGFLIFRAPFFSEASDHIEQLKQNLTGRLKTCSTPNNLSIQNYYFDGNSYLWVQIKICPDGQSYFNQTVIINCFDLNSQDYKPPELYGPYYFTASPYHISSRARQYIIGIAIGCAVLAALLALLAVYAVRQKKRAQREKLRNDPFASWGSMGEESGEAPKLRGAKAFTFDELKMYTNNFREINIIGSGGYGKVYRGMLPDKQLVAIKRSKEGSMQGNLEFKTEIELLSRVHHNNLVGLVGFCFEKGERMLVYEYICNKTLRDSLSGASGIQLNWSRRLKIARDSATGLAYLHDHANPPIIHRDVKSTNILLDENLTAKVSDFGLSLFVSNSEIGHVTNHVKGTMGYLDPEYYMTQQLTGKSDVYSFGVVMLELITAQLPIKDKKYIVREVKIAFNRQDKPYLGLKDLIDPLLTNKNESLVGLDRFVDLALQCVEEEASNRPTMSEIVKEIDGIMHNGGINIVNSGSGSWEKINPAQYYSMDVSSSSSQQNINSSDFKYSGGFPLHWKLNSS